MKKLSILIVATMAFVIIGCRKPIEVSFDNATEVIGAQGGLIEVALKSNCAWTIAQTEGWIMVSSMSGNGDATLTLTVAPNSTGESRSTEITASTKDNTAVLKLTQDAPQHYISVDPISILCGPEGGEFIVDQSTDIEWEVTTPLWVTSSLLNGSDDATITLTINPISGDMTGSREGEVVISGLDSISAKVIVVQDVNPNQDIHVMPKNLDFVCTGESKTVVVTTEGNWTASVGEDWVSLSQNEGQGNTEISVAVGENPMYELRQTSVVFTTATGAQAILAIRQEASPDPHFLEVSPLEFQFEKEGGEKEISVSCDAFWEFELYCDWLSLSQRSGTGNATVVLTAEPNVLLEARTADFRIKSGILNAEFIVSQAPGEEPIVASFQPDTLYVDFIGSIQTVQIRSNTTWQLQASSWITLVTSSGEGDATFDIVVDNNSNPDERIGYVRAVHNEQVIGMMVVVQEAWSSILETDVTELEVRPEGGTYEIQVSSNLSWKVTTDVNWIHCNPLSDFGNKILTVTVDAMEGVRPRTGHIKLSSEEGNSVNITVYQH